MSLRLLFATLKRVCERSFDARVTEFAMENYDRFQFSVKTDDRTFIVTVEEVI